MSDEEIKENYKVYRHISPNGKVYIGITKKKYVTDRWCRGKGYENNDYFTKAINKYGWDNFKHEILFENLTKEEACQKEIELIEEYKSNNPEFGYNLCAGGEGCTNYKHNEETKKLIGKYSKERMNNPEYLQNFRNKMLGHKTTNEAKLKMSLAKKGKPTHRSPTKGRICITNGIDYKMILPEELDKYKKLGFDIGGHKGINIGRWAGENNPMYGKVPWNKGKSMTAETKQKISADTSNRRWVHNEFENRFVKYYEVDSYLSKGYLLGRIKNKEES